MQFWRFQRSHCSICAYIIWNSCTGRCQNGRQKCSKQTCLNVVMLLYNSSLAFTAALIANKVVEGAVLDMELEAVIMHVCMIVCVKQQLVSSIARILWHACNEGCSVCCCYCLVCALFISLLLSCTSSLSHYALAVSCPPLVLGSMFSVPPISVSFPECRVCDQMMM